MTVVVGTAGHIDHGKTALLQALTGIDADRLPEERRRGMTIDLGYAHMTMADGAQLDLVDVPGHDRFIGNMLVGAGEIDAALLVVAADEGVSAQTREHLGLLDALGIRDGVVALTKADLLEADDPGRDARPAEVRALLAGTTLEGSPIVAVSARSGEGLDALRSALEALARRVAARAAPTDRGARLAVDRVFSVRGRGLVVTGTLRGGPIARGDNVRVEPGGRTARVREMQVRNQVVDHLAGGGRVALGLAGLERETVSRGMVLCSGPAVRATSRLFVTLRPVHGGRPLADGADLRLHLGTDVASGRLRLSGSSTDGLLAVLSLDRPVAAALDDRFVLRWPSPADTAAGGRVLDPWPARRLLRRRPDRATAAMLAQAGPAPARFASLVAAHGVLDGDAATAYRAGLGMALAPAVGPGAGGVMTGRLLIDPNLAASVADELLAVVRTHDEAGPSDPGASAAALRTLAAGLLRRQATLGSADAASAADAILAGLIDTGRLVRDGDAVRGPGRRPDLPAATRAAMDRLLDRLRTATPPDLQLAARAAGCPAEGWRALETEGRIVRVSADLAFATETWAGLEALAMRLGAAGPITPAAFRDASGTSRKYALAVLEELGARGLLRRGPDGHRLGPRAPRPEDRDPTTKAPAVGA